MKNSNRLALPHACGCSLVHQVFHLDINLLSRSTDAGKSKVSLLSRTLQHTRGKNAKKKVTQSMAAARGPEDPYTLSEVLKDDLLRAEFRRFLVQSFAEDHLDFYVDVENFRQNYDDSEAHRIASTYLDDKKPRINVSHRARLLVNERIQKQMGPRIFDLIQEDVAVILQSDLYPRYLLSESTNVVRAPESEEEPPKKSSRGRSFSLKNVFGGCTVSV
ncbi:regulator of G-protein signaling 10 [Planoprotostelium fungivorum]|uniref:Regulator of G-protein signaling 10 n=1 Tax=Planoprotostelium fungivorum TaxID=1890364 RepID=A0A2P6ND43_9EUKA|nr:regulator of G-protein signaling 10 [Planoprotostelium fungivorum]